MGNGVHKAVVCPWHTCTWQSEHIPGGLLPCLAMCSLKEWLLNTELVAIRAAEGSLNLSRVVGRTVVPPVALQAHEEGGG